MNGIKKHFMDPAIATTPAQAEESISVKDKKIILTGGSTGIGLATAKLLAKEGARLLICGRDEAKLQHALEEINEQAAVHAEGVAADVSKEKDIENLFAMADQFFGNDLDVLINNAAVPFQGIESGGYSDWCYVINTNLLGYMACCQFALQRMKPGNGGHIVNIGSLSADVRERGSSVYVATKAGIQGFCEALRKEVNEAGIKVTLIEPGAVGTDMQPVAPQQQREKEGRLEMLKAEDIAGAVLFTLLQPKRCDVIGLQIRPHLQII